MPNPMNDQRLTRLKNQLSEVTQQFDSQLSELRQQQDINTNSIVGLNQAVQSLLEVIRVDREIAREDRAVIREIQSEMREMQSEMREMHTEIGGCRSSVSAFGNICSDNKAMATNQVNILMH